MSVRRMWHRRHQSCWLFPELGGAVEEWLRTKVTARRRNIAPPKLHQNTAQTNRRADEVWQASPRVSPHYETLCAIHIFQPRPPWRTSSVYGGRTLADCVSPTVRLRLWCHLLLLQANSPQLMWLLKCAKGMAAIKSFFRVKGRKLIMSVATAEHPRLRWRKEWWKYNLLRANEKAVPFKKENSSNWSFLSQRISSLETRGPRHIFFF